MKKQPHRKQQTEIISGVHPVMEALRADRRKILEIYSSEEKFSGRIAQVHEQALTRNIPVKRVTQEELKRLAGAGRHQGVAARVSPLPILEFPDLIDRISGDSTPPFILAVDSVEDPQNLGALVRTALCVGITGIILPRDRTAPPTPAVSRASAGALEHVLLYRVTNLANTIKDLKKAGVWVIGLDMSGKQSIYETDMTGPRAIVIGGENTGIRRLVGELCDFLCHIPQTGPVGSLNASVAGAVTMYEAFRQRHIV